MRTLKTCMLCNAFENGDGIMIVQATDNGKHFVGYVRLLLTDGGHLGTQTCLGTRTLSGHGYGYGSNARQRTLEGGAVGTADNKAA